VELLDYEDELLAKCYQHDLTGEHNYFTRGIFCVNLAELDRMKLYK